MECVEFSVFYVCRLRLIFVNLNDDSNDDCAYKKHYDSTVIVRLPNDAIHLTISFRLGHCTDSFLRLNLVFVAFVSISAVQTFPFWLAWQNHRNHFLSIHLLSFMHDGSQLFASIIVIHWNDRFFYAKLKFTCNF